MDRAGWHIASELNIPDNLTPIFLPPYSPELNAIERVWLFLRERFLSHRVWRTYDDILSACCQAWNALVDDAGRMTLHHGRGSWRGKPLDCCPRERSG